MPANPDVVPAGLLQTLEKVSQFRGKTLQIRPLPGGLTNHNFQVECAGETYVVRVPGEQTTSLGIDRDVELDCTRVAASLGLGPEIIAWLPETSILVRQYLPGRVLEPADVRTPSTLERVATSLRRLHGASPVKGHSSAFATIRAYDAIAREHGVAMPAEVASALETCAMLEDLFRPDQGLVPCHNDLLAANLIDDGQRVRIIDWEYAGMGNPFFDLGNLAANGGFDDADEERLLASYFGVVQPGELQRLRRMRLVSDLREAMWGFAQAGLSSLPIDYLGYGQRHLDRCLAQRPRCDLPQ